jgi:hypothetical protein
MGINLEELIDKVMSMREDQMKAMGIDQWGSSGYKANQERAYQDSQRSERNKRYDEIQKQRDLMSEGASNRQQGLALENIKYGPGGSADRTANVAANAQTGVADISGRWGNTTAQTQGAAHKDVADISGRWGNTTAQTQGQTLSNIEGQRQAGETTRTGMINQAHLDQQAQQAALQAEALKGNRTYETMSELYQKHGDDEAAINKEYQDIYNAGGGKFLSLPQAKAYLERGATANDQRSIGEKLKAFSNQGLSGLTPPKVNQAVKEFVTPGLETFKNMNPANDVMDRITHHGGGIRSSMGQDGIPRFHNDDQSQYDLR